jgi:hypothetical protein
MSRSDRRPRRANVRQQKSSFVDAALVRGASEPSADCVTDHGEWKPRSDEEAVPAHEPAAVAEGKEGSPEFFDCSTVFAETFAGGQVKHPDTDDREDDQAGDPGVGSDIVLLQSSYDCAAEHGDKGGKNSGENLGSC